MGDNMLVAKGYRPVDRDQYFLLPPSMRDWLPDSDPVWLVIETVASLDTSVLHAQRKTGGVGRAGYDPDMLLTLLIWGWAHGQRSSRQLERLCHRDIAYRIICAGDAPDHVTISRFRADCATAVEDLFAQVLVLCARLGMVNIGVVALDGVKIASNASMSANRTEDGLRAAMAAQAARAASEHADVDAAEDEMFGADDRGDEVPGDLVDPRSRSARIAAALADLQDHNTKQAAENNAADERAQAREAAAEQARQARAEKVARWREQHPPGSRSARVPTEIRVEVHTANLERIRAAQQAKIDRWRPGQPGPRPVPVDDHYDVVRARNTLERATAERVARQAAEGTRTRDAAARKEADRRAAATHPRTLTDPKRNITDPESRLMMLRGGGWIQGFNCQAVTSSDGLFLATGVGNNPADVVAFAAMLDKAVAAADDIANHRPTSAPEGDAAGIGVFLADAGYLSNENLTSQGPDRLIAIGKARRINKTAREQPTTGPPPPGATPIEAMRHRLATPEGHALYAQRGHIAETPFGHAKHNLGFRRFTSRGLDRATAEFAFHALVHNLFKAIRGGHLTPGTA